MQSHPKHKATFFLALAFPAIAAPTLDAFPGEALPDRPGFGYTIQFTTGTTAEALLPVERQALPVRPGFGYTINFEPGDPADSLYPPDWVKQRGTTLLSRD